MKPTIFFALLLAWCCNALAAGAGLLQARDYMSVAQESQLASTESATLALVRSDAHTKASYLVTLNVAAFGSGAITVRLPDGKDYEFVGNKTVDLKRPGLFTWASWAPGSNAVISGDDKGHLSGEIYAGGKNYRVVAISPQRHVLIETQALPNDENDKTFEVPKSKSTAPKMQTMSTPASKTVRIMTAWSPAAIAQVGGNYVGETLNLITRLKQSFLVATMNGQIDVEDAGTFVVAASYDSPQFNALAMDIEPAIDDYPLMAARDTAQADLIIMVVHCAACGGNEQGSAYIGANGPYTGVAVVEFTSSGYPTYNYMHQFGHQMGARHQVAGGIDNDATFGSMHGFLWRQTETVGTFAGSTSCFHSLMANASNTGPACTWPDYREPAWSDPTLYWRCGGTYQCIPFGDSLAYDSATLRARVAATAMLRLIPGGPHILNKRFIPSAASMLLN